MVGDGEGGGRAVKVDHPTQIFFVRIFFEDATSDVDLFLNDSISTHWLDSDLIPGLSENFVLEPRYRSMKY